MEYIDGITLTKFVENNYPLKINKIIELIIQLFIAVSHLHSNKIYHRDIKPDNIMINNNHKIILMDYGVIKNIDETTISKSDQEI